MSHNERYDINKSLILFKQGEIDLNTLLEHCTIVIKTAICKKIGYILEDWLQEGYIIALKCIKEYDQKKHKHSFATHLYNHVQWGIMTCVWNDRLIRKPEYLFKKGLSRENFSITTWEKTMSNGHILNIMDLIDNDTSISNVENKILLEGYLKKLNSRQKEVVRLHFFEGYSLKEIGDMNKNSRQNIHNEMKSILQKMNSTKKKKEKTKVTKLPKHVVDYVKNSNKAVKDLVVETGLSTGIIYSLKSSNVICI